MKKRSARLDEPFVFFVDRCLGRHTVPNALRQAVDPDEHVEIHDDHFTQDASDEQEAFTQLKVAFQLAIWFQRSFGNNPKFDPGPLVPPNDVEAETQQLREELFVLRQVSTGTQTRAYSVNTA